MTEKIKKWETKRRKWLNNKAAQQKEWKHELETVLAYFNFKGCHHCLDRGKLGFYVFNGNRFCVDASKESGPKEERNLRVYCITSTDYTSGKEYSCESIDGPWIPAIKETIKGWSAELLELKNKKKQKEEQKIQNFRQEWQK